MKRIVRILSCFILLAMLSALLALTACVKKNESEGLYKPDGFAQTVYVIKASNMSRAEREMITSLQGILAQHKATIFIEDLDGVAESQNTKYWLDDLIDRYGIKVEYVRNPWTLLSMFSNYITDCKYVLYTSPETSDNAYDQSINMAATVSGVEGYIMIDKSIELLAVSRGFTLGKDVTGSTFREIFEEYKDRLNKNYIVHQSPERSELRDYAIAGKVFCYYSDHVTDTKLSAEVLAWANSNCVVLGWTEDELNFVASCSLYAKAVIPADWSSNLSFYAALDKENEIIKQSYTQEKITADPNKHYVAIVMSDGDNIQWIQRNFIDSTSYFGSKYRGEFKLTWGISPSLYDLAPSIAERVYSNQSANDQFISGPGGLGYTNITNYDKEELAEYAKMTASYMEKMDLHYANFLDAYVDEEALKYFAEQDQIEGGIWNIGNKYVGAQGGVYWENGKPFVSVRETLWRESSGIDNEYYGYTERVAQRINSYKCDPTSIEGYTVVVAHVWSIGTMDHIARFVNSLDEHVELVTVGELIELVKENVEQKNVYELDDIKPSDLNDSLVPITSEQLIWKDIKDKETTTRRTFEFNNMADLGGFVLECGNLGCDKAVWVVDKGCSVMLDGSDMGDYLDVLPNSWIYNAFEFGEDDDILTINIYAGDKADVSFRIKALYEDENGNLVTVYLKDGFNNSVDRYGYYLLATNSDSCYTFDISFLQGKKVILSFEQDDSGEGNGEIVYIDYITITSN